MMGTMYPKQYYEMCFHDCVGDTYYFYMKDNPQRIFTGDYSDFDMWRKAKLELECKEALRRYDEELNK